MTSAYVCMCRYAHLPTYPLPIHMDTYTRQNFMCTNAQIPLPIASTVIVQAFYPTTLCHTMLHRYHTILHTHRQIVHTRSYSSCIYASLDMYIYIYTFYFVRMFMQLICNLYAVMCQCLCKSV